MFSRFMTGLVLTLATWLTVACGGGGSDAPVLMSIEVTPANASQPLGLTQQFTATGTYSDGSKRDISSGVFWFSDCFSCAKIDAKSGLLQTLQSGVTSVSARQDEVVGYASFTVRAAELVSLRVAPMTSSLSVGMTQAFQASATWTDGSIGDVTLLSGWTSSNPGVVTLSTFPTPVGVATAVGPGTTTITATFSPSVGTLSSTAVLTVLP